MVGRKTDSGRLNRAIKRIAEWYRRNRHLPWKEQHQTLTAKLLGHFAYYGIPLNSTAITAFHHQVRRIWFTWLNRRSRQRDLNWQQFGDFLKRFPLPRARIVHSWS
jgi:hypothetical protein